MDKPYTEPLGGSYLVDKPGAKPVRQEFTEHRRTGKPTETELAAEAVAEEPKPDAPPTQAEKKGK